MLDNCKYINKQIIVLRVWVCTKEGSVIQLTDLMLQIEDMQKEAEACAQEHVKSHSVDCTKVSLLPR